MAKEIKVFNTAEEAIEAVGGKILTEEQAMAMTVADEEEEDEYSEQDQPIVEENIEEQQPIADGTEPQQEEEVSQTETEPQENSGRSFKFGSTQEEPTNQESQTVEVDENVLLTKLSEKLGREFKSFEDVSTAIENKQQTAPNLDDELQMLLKFKQETGRSLNDFMLYQSLNTSEIDDINAVRLSFQVEYPELNAEEREDLLMSRYKLDEDLYDEREVRVSKAQLKADGAKAKREIEKIRLEYLVPKQAPKEEVAVEQEVSMFDDEWYGSASKAIDELNGLEFATSKDTKFTFGIDDNYKASLKKANKNIENFFDQYINSDGSWNHDLFNAHEAAKANIEKIVAEAFKQGLSQGQKELLKRNVNANPEPPRGGGQQKENSARKHLEEIMGGGQRMTVKL